MVTHTKSEARPAATKDWAAVHVLHSPRVRTPMPTDDPLPTDPPPGFTPIYGHLNSPPPSVKVHVEFGARSRRAPLRSINEDHYLILRAGRHLETLVTSLPEDEIPKRFDEFAYGMVIADGVGRGGEVASRLAITTLSHLLVHFGKWNVRIDEPTAEEVMDRAERFYRDVDATMVQAGKHSPLGLQTTLTAVVTAGNELFFAHVGHSRAYLFRDGKLLKLTHDHTLAGERPGRVASADLTGSARDLHHTLTETIGRTRAGGPRIDVERCGILDGDIVLLCTNGLTDVVDDAHIANELQRHNTPDEQCRALVGLSIESKTEDDVTAVVAHYHIPG